MNHKVKDARVAYVVDEKRLKSSHNHQSLNPVQAGFKHTEVGLIPIDWDIVSIDECAIKVGSGKTPTGGSSVYIDSGRMFIRSQNVDWGKLELSDVAYISEHTHSTFQGSELCENDVLLNITGASIGRCARADKRIAGGNVNQHVCIIRTKSTKLNPSLLVELINSPFGQNQIESYQAGGNREGLNFSQVRNLKFAIPIVQKEQAAIANVLSDVDSLIDSLERLIAKKQAIKTATMQQLLTGRTRLPQFARRPDGILKGTKQTELGEIPEDWEVALLGTAARFINGRAYALYEWESHGTPVIRLQNLTGRGEDYYYSTLQLPEKHYCDFGDLLFMWSATFGPIIWKGGRAIYHYHIWKIENNEGYEKLFLFYLLSDMTEKLKQGSSSGGTMLHVTKEKMESTKAIIPSLEEQNEIALILADIDHEIKNHEHRLAKTRQLKLGMMQELLTGKTRLV